MATFNKNMKIEIVVERQLRNHLIPLEVLFVSFIRFLIQNPMS